MGDGGWDETRYINFSAISIDIVGHNFFLTMFVYFMTNNYPSVFVITDVAYESEETMHSYFNHAYI